MEIMLPKKIRSMMFLDASAIIASFVCTYILMSSVMFAFDNAYVSPFTLMYERFFGLSLSLFGFVAFLFFKGNYDAKMSVWDEAKHVTSASVFCLLLEGFLTYAHKADVSRTSMFLTWVFAPLAVMAFRIILFNTHGAGRYKQTRAIIFGRDQEAARVESLLKKDRHYSFEIVDKVNIQDFQVALDAIRRLDVRDVIVALSLSDPKEIDFINFLRENGQNISIVPPALGMSASMSAHYVMGSDAIILMNRPNSARQFGEYAKRVFDVFVASTMLIVLSPLIAFFAAIVSMDGHFPFYAQKRVGKGGASFDCFKIRSMAVDSDIRLKDLLAKDPEAKEEWERSRKLKNDPRVTMIGKFIRKASIDELPQLWNVIRGDMSLIGPRPVTEPELEMYGRHQSLYKQVKPGITGLWQVIGRSELSYEERIALDAWYVENWSMWHDIAILSKTVPVVFGRKGAY